jgi:septum formation protein
MHLAQYKPIVLASGSPRRKDYLNKYNLNFEIITGNIDESVRPGELPEYFARRMALEKANAVLPKCTSDAVVIAADTIVVFENEILGKPASPADVLPMLKKLNGKTHNVITAYQIVDKDTGEEISRSAFTEVRFNHLSNHLLQAYSESEEPLDKAGAYSIQGLGTVLVESINGSYNNVVGLPVEMLLQDLIDLKVISAK